MKLQDIVQESFSSIDVANLGIDRLVDQADQDLPEPAATAIERFVGMIPQAKERGITMGVMQSQKLENAFGPNPSEQGQLIRQQLNHSFAPVKQYLKNKFGNVIKLYRAQQSIDLPAKPRHTLSWTSDWSVAAQMILDPQLLQIQPIANSTIDKALEKYHQTGRVKFYGKTYVKTDQPTQDQEQDEFYYEIYKGPELITDGDDIRQEFVRQQEYVNDLVQRRDQQLKQIIEADIPIDDIIWITNRAGQSEFIIHNQPGKTSYINPHGKFEKR